MWLTFFLLTSDFDHGTSALLIKSVGATAHQCCFEFAQFLTINYNITYASSSFRLGTSYWVLTTVFTAPSKFYGQAERAISTGKLRALLPFHLQPINQVVFLGPSLPLWVGRSHLEECFPLICIQRLSLPNFATERCHWHDSSNTRGSSIPVLSY